MSNRNLIRVRREANGSNLPVITFSNGSRIHGDAPWHVSMNLLEVNESFIAGGTVANMKKMAKYHRMVGNVERSKQFYVHPEGLINGKPHFRCVRTS